MATGSRWELHTTLTSTSIEILASIAKFEGEPEVRETGVLFTHMPRGRTKHPRTGRVYNERSFWPLENRGLIDVGNGRTDPVLTTRAGRDLLQRVNEIGLRAALKEV